MKDNLYTPSQVKRLSESEVRKAYSELRSVANKRLQRLDKANLNIESRKGYRFPTISQVQESSKSTLASELADVSRFLRSDRTTVKGAKKYLSKFREVMQEYGYDDLVKTDEDILNTIQFLDEMADIYGDTLYSSGDLLDVLQEVERLNIPHDMLRDNMDLFIAHIDELEKVKPTKGGRTFSKSRLNALIKKWE